MGSSGTLSAHPRTRRLRFVARLPFIFFFALMVVFAVPRSARAACSPASGAAPCPNAAASPTARPEPSELVRPSSGNDTFKLASLGVVFLIIGAAVVYAPQIVSSITGLPRRMSGSRRKAAVNKAAPTPKPPQPAREYETAVIELPPPPPPIARPPPVKVEIPGSQDVVSRLQNEIRSAWSKTR